MKQFIFLGLLIGGFQGYCQDTITNKLSAGMIRFDTTVEYSFEGIKPEFIYLNHAPKKSDYRLYKSCAHLIGQQPNSKNYRNYYAFACSLWEIGKLPEAEKMFLTIINSGNGYYDSTYSNSSDIPGDHSSPVYGYGRYTSNYKNSASIYLTKINIEHKRFSKAFKYLGDAINRYKVSYSCGTGYMMQQYEYNILYTSCCRGMSREILDLLLPGDLIHNLDTFVRAIKEHLGEVAN
jgi:hypothetical protein